MISVRQGEALKVTAGGSCVVRDMLTQAVEDLSQALRFHLMVVFRGD